MIESQKMCDPTLWGKVDNNTIKGNSSLRNNCYNLIWFHLYIGIKLIKTKIGLSELTSFGPNFFCSLIFIVLSFGQNENHTYLFLMINFVILTHQYFFNMYYYQYVLLSICITINMYYYQYVLLSICITINLNHKIVHQSEYKLGQ
jgi:hypothetical protein